MTFADTSREAFCNAQITADWLREEAVRLLKLHGGLTADEIAKHCDVNVLSMRPRITELHKAGTITKSKLRRKNTSGATAIVWDAA